MSLQLKFTFTRLIVVVFSLSLFLSGCFMIGPDYQPPQANNPDAWHNAAARDLKTSDAPLSSWWQTFKDPDLDQIMIDVRSNNYSLATAFARVEESAAYYGIARSPMLPEVISGGGYQRSRDSERVKSKSSHPQNPYNLYQAGFNASWEVDMWGRVARGVESAGATFDSTIEEYRDLLVVLQANAAATYIGIRTSQQRLLFARNNVALQQETLQLTRDRFKAELTGELDVRQAELNIASTMALVPQLEIDLVQRVNQLCFLAGKQPGAYDYLLSATNAIPHIQEVPAVLPADLLRNRPDIRAAERKLAAQTALIGVARGDLYPMFALNGFFDWQASSGSDWFDPKARTYGFGPSFRWSIFNYGRIRNQIAVETTRTKQALANYEQSVLAAWQESEDAMIAYVKEMKRNKILQDATLAAQRSTALVETLYKTGLTDFQNVLDMQRQLFQQQDLLAISEGAVAANLIGIYKAFGGGWQAEKD
ncbi:MAG: efflux transporter outer membrane subunit [Kiritimatiellae bacterium]|nr:efflux transporter outer membrane subunit [Kiritimatiellia bacterium]